MALIKCPECGKEISEYAYTCVNCGFPMKEYLQSVEAEGMDLEDDGYHDGEFDEPEIAIEDIKQSLGKIVSNNNPTTNQSGATNYSSANVPKCPTCGSTNVQKLGVAERAVTTWAVGMASKKINKSFKCNNCGYTW